MFNDIDGMIGLDGEYKRGVARTIEVKYADMERQMEGFREMENYPCMRRIKKENDSLKMNPRNGRLVFLTARTMKLKCIPLRAISAQGNDKP